MQAIRQSQTYTLTHGILVEMGRWVCLMKAEDNLYFAISNESNCLLVLPAEIMNGILPCLVLVQSALECEGPDL